MIPLHQSEALDKLHGNVYYRAMSTSSGLINHLPESLIVDVWQHQVMGRTDLRTEDDEPIKIIYPGRINDDRGADLLDAIIATNHGPLKGDIEIHVKSSGWRAHRHHRDPRYNRVILHAVFWCDTGATSELQNGEMVPILALHKYVKDPMAAHNNYEHSLTNLGMRCHRAFGFSNTYFMGEFLDSAGEARFAGKAARFQTELSRTEASQSLYQGIMAALGYAKNKLPFQELAHKLPIQTLESFTRGNLSGEACLVRQQTAILADRWVGRLEKAWASAPQTGAMSEDNWHLFKVRPTNFPTRRIAAMTYLINRYKEKGMFAEMVNQIRDVPVDTGCHQLEKALMVNTDSYWASHFDFGPGSRLIAPALLGGGRAADIVVNVVLPFAFAWSKLASRPELARKALELYRRHPKLSANTIERHMVKQLGISGNLVNSACRQQGLLHIYKTLCSQGRCSYCSL